MEVRFLSGVFPVNLLKQGDWARLAEFLRTVHALPSSLHFVFIFGLKPLQNRYAFCPAFELVVPMECLRWRNRTEVYFDRGSYIFTNLVLEILLGHWVGYPIPAGSLAVDACRPPRPPADVVGVPAKGAPRDAFHSQDSCHQRFPAPRVARPVSLLPLTRVDWFH